MRPALEQAAATLERINAGRRSLDCREYLVLHHLRADGASWIEIADLLGYKSAEGASRRFRRLEDDLAARRQDEGGALSRG